MENHLQSLRVKDTNNNTDSEELFDNLDDEQNEWQNADEAADYLRISKSQLYNLCNSGTIRYYKLGRRSRFRREDLRELLLQNRRGGFNG